MNQTRVYSILILMNLLLLISRGAYAVDVEAGRVTATQCAVCHGIEGEGNGIPNSCIACIDTEKFKQHLNAFKSGARKNFVMERFVKNLSDQDIENLAAYYASK